MDTSSDIKYPIRVYRKLELHEQLVIFADPADSHDDCAAVVMSKKHNDSPIVFNSVMESGQFGYELNNLGKYIFNQTNVWPKLAVERNTGQATIFVLKTLNYPDLFRMVDFTATDSHEGGGIGWVTTGHMSGGELQGTRRKMLDDFGMAVRQKNVLLYDEQQIRQIMSFMVVKGRGQQRANRKDDLVMATAGAWQIHQVTPDSDFGEVDENALRQNRDKWRFR